MTEPTKTIIGIILGLIALYACAVLIPGIGG